MGFSDNFANWNLNQPPPNWTDTRQPFCKEKKQSLNSNIPTAEFARAINTFSLCFCKAKLFSMYSFSRLLSLSFNAKSLHNLIKNPFPVDILHVGLLHSRSSAVACPHDFVIQFEFLTFFANQTFPSLNAPLGWALAIFCCWFALKRALGSSSQASHISQKKPASSK